MDEYTYCLWLNMEEGNTQCYPASVASKSYANELLIGWYELDKDDTKIYIAGKNDPIRVPLSQDLRTAVKNGWHKHCFVNKKGHYIKWFMDRQKPGVVEEIQTVPSVTGILAGSALILLQEQDSFKGSLVLNQVCQSKMSMFNMWDKAMTQTELNTLRCQDQGNVVNMSNISSMGGEPEYETYPLPCHQGDFLTEENVYVQRDTIDNYLYKYDLPAMDEYTYCLWLNMEEGITECYPASVSSKSYANELLIGWYQLDKDDTKIYIAGKNAPIRVPLSQDLRTAVKNGWHKHCFVNKKGHYIKWFMDRQTPGLMEEIQTVASVTGIAADSALVLLQDQDSFKGSLVLNQVCQSKMSMFNMWDKAMTLSELNALGCQDKGTVVNMDSITSMGAAPEYESYLFPCLQSETAYVQDLTITDYLYKYDLPAMDDYTYCLWLDIDDKIPECYPASISSKSHPNEHLIGWYKLDKDESKIDISKKGAPIFLPLSQDLRTAVKNGWHKHCFVNKKGYFVKWFMDRQTPGVMEEVLTADSSTGISAGSALILLQEQDSFKNGLLLSQVCQSKMSMFNMWDKAMTQAELNVLSCQDQGNVVNMNNIDSIGARPKFVMETLPCPSA